MADGRPVQCSRRAHGAPSLPRRCRHHGSLPFGCPLIILKTPNGGTHPKCFTGYQKRTRKAHPKTPESTRSHPTAPEMLVKLITFAPERHPKHFEHYHFCTPRRPKSASAAQVVKAGRFTTCAAAAAEVAKTGRFTTSARKAGEAHESKSYDNLRLVKC